MFKWNKLKEYIFHKLLMVKHVIHTWPDSCIYLFNDFGHYNFQFH